MKKDNNQEGEEGEEASIKMKKTNLLKIITMEIGIIIMLLQTAIIMQDGETLMIMTSRCPMLIINNLMIGELNKKIVKMR